MIDVVRPTGRPRVLPRLHEPTAFHHDGTMDTMDTMKGPFESKQATDNTENTDPNPCAVPLTRGHATRRRAEPTRTSPDTSEPGTRSGGLDSTTIRAARGGQRDDPCHPWTLRHRDHRVIVLIAKRSCQARPVLDAIFYILNNKTGLFVGGSVG